VIGLDTNVLVRYIVRDDPRQTAVADQLIASLTAAEPGFVTQVVLVELWWVLVRSYKRTHAECGKLFDALLDTDELAIESLVSAKTALAAAQRGADFADALIVANCQIAGCDHIITLDESATKQAGMALAPPG
jgi:predicted nucleic-acid-binding protein